MAAEVVLTARRRAAVEAEGVMATRRGERHSALSVNDFLRICGQLLRQRGALSPAQSDDAGCRTGIARHCLRITGCFCHESGILGGKTGRAAKRKGSFT